MACKVKIQPTALRELESILDYLSGFSRKTAASFLEKWTAMLYDLQDGLVEHRVSRFETLARLGYRTLLLDGYIVLYFKEGESVVIAHIFHQSQDYANIVLNGV